MERTSKSGVQQRRRNAARATRVDPTRTLAPALIRTPTTSFDTVASLQLAAYIYGVVMNDSDDAFGSAPHRTSWRTTYITAFACHRGDARQPWHRAEAMREQSVVATITAIFAGLSQRSCSSSILCADERLRRMGGLHND